MFSAASFDEEKVSYFRKALEKGIVDFKEAQSIFDLRDLGYIDQRLRKIILKSLFMADVYYKSMIALAEDLKTFLQAIIGPNGMYEIAEYCDWRVPNTYPLLVPEEYHKQAEAVYGLSDLARIDANLEDIQYLKDVPAVCTMYQQSRASMKQHLEQLNQLTKHAPPEVSYIITTDPDKLEKDPETGLPHVASCYIAHSVVYLHPYFFTLKPEKQLEILYHELISHIYKGIRDEKEAMEDTRLFFGQPQPDCLGSPAFTAAKRMKGIYQRICHGIYLVLQPLFILSKKVNVSKKVNLPLTSLDFSRGSIENIREFGDTEAIKSGREEQWGATSPVAGLPRVREAILWGWGPSPTPLSQRDFTGPAPVSSLKMANNRRIAAFTIPEVLLSILALGAIAGTILTATIPRDLKAGLFLPIYIGVAGLAVCALSRLRVMTILKHYAPCTMPHARKTPISRRNFLRTAAVAVAGLVTVPSVLAAREEDYLAAEEDNPLAEENDRPRALEIIDGVYYIFGEPSQFRGLTWYPVSKGQSREEMNYKTSSWQQDIALMKNLRINTVRLYYPIYSYDEDNNTIDFEFINGVLDAFYDAGIGVIMGFPYYDDRYAWGPDISAGRIGQFPGLVTIGDYIAAFCEHPAVMMWELGNEYNIHPEWFGGNIFSWYAELKEAVAEIRLIDSSRPVGTVLAEKEDDELKEDINKCRDCGVDIIGMNLYNWNDPSEFIKSGLNFRQAAEGVWRCIFLRPALILTTAF